MQVTLSPFRFQRLMMVMKSLNPPPEPGPDGTASTNADAAGGTAGDDDAPLWQSEAEYKSKIAVLSWEGIGAATAKWHQNRWLYVWRGRLYITAREDDREPLQTKTYWKGYRVVYLPPTVRVGRSVAGRVMCFTSKQASLRRAEPSPPAALLPVSYCRPTFLRTDTQPTHNPPPSPPQPTPKAVAGAENVLAVVPTGLKRDAAAESSEALVMRAADTAAAGDMRKKLIQSASQMAAVAGLLRVRVSGLGWCCTALGRIAAA